MNSVRIPALTETVLLDAEDRHRMTRLYEEVLTRLEEMAMITSRNLGLNPGAASDVLFRPLAPGNLDQFNAVEVVRGSNVSGCYDYGQGICFEYNPRQGSPEQPVS